jgi:hypothetical protein
MRAERPQSHKYVFPARAIDSWYSGVTVILFEAKLRSVCRVMHVQLSPVMPQSRPFRDAPSANFFLPPFLNSLRRGTTHAETHPLIIL